HAGLRDRRHRGQQAFQRPEYDPWRVLHDERGRQAELPAGEPQRHDHLSKAHERVGRRAARAGRARGLLSARDRSGRVALGGALARDRVAAHRYEISVRAADARAIAFARRNAAGLASKRSHRSIRRKSMALIPYVDESKAAEKTRELLNRARLKMNVGRMIANSDAAYYPFSMLGNS